MKSFVIKFRVICVCNLHAEDVWCVGWGGGHVPKGAAKSQYPA